MSHKRKYKKDSFTGEKKKAWNRGKRTKMPATVIEGLAATDKGSFYNQQAWLEEYTYGEGLYYKREHSNSSDFFSDVKSSYGKSDSDSDYFEEPLKKNKEIKIDYGNTSDVKKPNSRDKNIIIFIDSLTTLIAKFAVCKKCHGQIKVIEDYSNSVGLARTFKIECNRKENSLRMTPKNGRFHEINLAFVLACRLLGKGRAGGRKLTALLNLYEPIRKKA